MYGDKVTDETGNPSGLIKSSQADGSPGIIFVAMNYRLGAFGFLSGPSLEAAGGVSNAGLYDQRLALEWVQQNIHLFGGDPTKVTIMGDSAGGGSAVHQITAYGAQQPVPFTRAIVQSPGWVPVISPYVQENTTQTFLATLGVSSIAEARDAPSLAVQAANVAFIGSASYGSFRVGPVVDGVFAPNLPGLAFLNGAYAKNVSVLATHNTNEAPSFTAPYVQTDAELEAYFLQSFPTVQPAVLNYIVHTLYPLSDYPTPIDRTFAIINELLFNCTTYYLAEAYANTTYNYQFEVPPALHAFDAPYFFYNGQGTNLTAGLFAPVAQVMQGYITNFASTGNPNRPGLPFFPQYGPGATEMGLNVSISAQGIVPDIKTQTDPTANPRCAWWQKGLYL